MKKSALFVSLVFAASLSAGSALAQEEAGESGQAGTGQQQEQSAAQGEQQQGIQAADDIRGYSIQSNAGENLGTVSDLLVDVEQGKIGYAVVSSGGVMGMGEKSYIVPFNALQFDPSQQVLTLSIERDQLKEAPSGDVAQSLDRETGREIHQFYGVSPYWEEGAAQEQQPSDLQQEQMQEPSAEEPMEQPEQQQEPQEQPQQQQGM